MGLEIVMVSTDYPNRPAHRGHTIEIQGWNDKYVLLVIRSDDRVNEALIPIEELEALVAKAKADINRW